MATGPEIKPPEKPVIKENWEKTIEKPKWEFEENPLTIRDMMDMKVPLKEIFEVTGVTMPIKWTSLIRIVNHKMVKGKKLDLDTTVKDAIAAYSECMISVFL